MKIPDYSKKKNVEYEKEYKVELTKDGVEYFYNILLEEKDKEIKRLNNIINELEKELINCIKETKLKWGNQLTDKGYLDIQMTIKNYEDILNKLQELKGSDKE